MSDHVEIANLVYTYAEHRPRRLHPGEALFSAQSSPPIRRRRRDPGSAAARECGQWTRYADPRSPTGHTLHTKHVTTNLQVHLDPAGGTARTRCYFTVLMQTQTLPLQPIIAGRYHDEFEKHDGRWCFTRRHILTDLVGNLSEHLLLELG
jgi:hypothetical protein